MPLNESSPVTPGIYKTTMQLKNGTSIKYTLSIPQNYASGQKVPLVVALHYGGPVSPYYSHGFMSVLVNPGLKGLGAIIIAPDCPGGTWESREAESLIIELMDHIKDNYAIDPDKVLLTGFSMGGIGTWYMAARYPSLFSAAIPISSMAGKTSQKLLSGSIPFYAIQSSGDELFDIDKFKEMVKSLQQKGIPVQLEILKGISHYRTDQFVNPLQGAIPWIKKTWANHTLLNVNGIKSTFDFKE